MQRLVACVLLGCHVLCARWPCGCMCVAARRHIHNTSRRTRVIPVVDRSNISAFYIIAFGAVGVFIDLSVLGLQIQIGSNRSFARRRKNMLQKELPYEECVDYNFVG